MRSELKMVCQALEHEQIHWGCAFDTEAAPERLHAPWAAVISRHVRSCVMNVS